MRGRWFAGWIVVGALGALTALGALSIGIFVLPFFLLTGILVARRTRYPTDVIGLVSGIGVMLLVVAFINRDSHPCVDGASFGSCGGFDPHSWFIAGLGFVLGGLALYLLVRLSSRIRPCRRSTS
jgi:hypothetical protein